MGKSTLFNCLSNAKAQAANFPFCTVEPNIGVITVPDERLKQLSDLVHPEKLVPTTVEIVDIAGLVKGASKGEGLGNQFLGNIRETDAIIHVVRCFDDDNVVHVDGSIDPVRDKEVIDAELMLKDLETVEKRVYQDEKIAKSGDKDAQKSLAIMLKVKRSLEEGKPARSIDLDKKEKIILAELYLLTSKPILYVCNVDEASAVSGNDYVTQLKEAVKDENAELLVIAAEIESEIVELDTVEDRQEFLEEMGLKEPGVSKLIQSAYKLLKLDTFFTAGVKEVRAWTIKRGSTAPQAAGAIHSDFEKGFIRVELIKFTDYIQYGSESACRDAGKLAIEGKDYVVADGDVMHFRFNV